MQLVLDSENTAIDIERKMTSVDHASAGEKFDDVVMTESKDVIDESKTKSLSGNENGETTEPTKSLTGNENGETTEPETIHATDDVDAELIKQATGNNLNENGNSIEGAKTGSVTGNEQGTESKDSGYDELQSINEIDMKVDSVKETIDNSAITTEPGDVINDTKSATFDEVNKTATSSEEINERNQPIPKSIKSDIEEIEKEIVDEADTTDKVGISAEKDDLSKELQTDVHMTDEQVDAEKMTVVCTDAEIIDSIEENVTEIGISEIVQEESVAESNATADKISDVCANTIKVNSVENETETGTSENLCIDEEDSDEATPKKIEESLYATIHTSDLTKTDANVSATDMAVETNNISNEENIDLNSDVDDAENNLSEIAMTTPTENSTDDAACNKEEVTNSVNENVSDDNKDKDSEQDLTSTNQESVKSEIKDKEFLISPVADAKLTENLSIQKSLDDEKCDKVETDNTAEIQNSNKNELENISDVIMEHESVSDKNESESISDAIMEHESPSVAISDNKMETDACETVSGEVVTDKAEEQEIPIDLNSSSSQNFSSSVISKDETVVAEVTNVDVEDKIKENISDNKMETDACETVSDDVETDKADHQEIPIDLNSSSSQNSSSSVKSKDDTVVAEVTNVDIEDKTEEKQEKKEAEALPRETEPKPEENKFKLSNTLDILSDDDEEPPKKIGTSHEKSTNSQEKQTINLDDDDDIMLIDDEPNPKDGKEPSFAQDPPKDERRISMETVDLDPKEPEIAKETSENKEPSIPVDVPVADRSETPQLDKPKEIESPREKRKPLVPENFFKSYKKNLTDMTREDLEEFCILKIVESIIDRGSLNETKTKLKLATQTVEDLKKKTTALTKQNRDLQVVLKSVQEEQKKNSNTITPLKITRSVGMQVLMSENRMKKKNLLGNPVASNANSNTNTVKRMNKPIRVQKPAMNPPIPVPRLVPATNITKSPVQMGVNNAGKSSPMTNGMKNTPPPAPKPEKRTHSRMQSVTVDLTDDEPPAKVVTKSPAPPVRLVPSQNLMARQPPGLGTSPRKVFIPISANQGHLRPGQTLMVKSVTPSQVPRQQGPRLTAPVRLPQNTPRLPRTQGRHPAPLPDAMKQYQPPNWKVLPPAPDLKLSKVENGIVISWKIEGYQEDSYEEIASYQLFAYQETSAPPSTNLWKKIGDVKALPLPMACTLTQFMAGYKYYFAVRAVDIRSRLGPFSLPGSILLLNKM